MIDAYDPDIIVASRSTSISHLDIGERREAKLDDLFDSLLRSGCPKYGVGMEDLLGNLVDEEYRFERRFPIQIYIPVVGRQTADFTAVLYGVLPDKIDSNFRSFWKQYIDFEEPKGWSSSHIHHLSPRNLFPIRMTTLKLSWRQSSPLVYGNRVFVMDPKSYVDLIDFWNLRALGWRIIPAPVTLLKDEEYLQVHADLIERHYQRSAAKGRTDSSTQVLKSRTIDETEYSKFVKSLPITMPSNPRQWRITQKSHFPRVWSRWARPYDDVSVCKIECARDEREVTESAIGFRYTPLKPHFEVSESDVSEFVYANELELSAWSPDKTYASTLPEGHSQVLFAMGANVFKNWRISHSGAVNLCRPRDTGDFLKFPESQDVMRMWFGSMGWSVELSSAGMIVNQVIKISGGVGRLGFLANGEVIRLIQRASDTQASEDLGRGISDKEFWRSMRVVDKGNPYPIGPEYVAKSLLDLGVFKLGQVTRCPFCQQRSWYSLSEFDYSLVCKVCTESFDAPTHSIKELKWHYKTTGPFALPNRAHGALSVLLAMRFFEVVMHGSVCSLPSFTEKSRNIEVDLAMYVDLSLYHGGSKHLLLFECKTEAPFRRKDRVRMERLSVDFPRAILVFVTLRDQLEQAEKILLKPLVNRSRRERLAGGQYNPVLILTANELFASWPLSGRWKQLSAKHRKFENRPKVDSNVIELCDVTHQLYLDMNSWDDWLDIRFGKKKSRRT